MKTKIKLEDQEEPALYSNDGQGCSLRIGELELASSSGDLELLSIIAANLLKMKQVQQALGLSQRKKMMTGVN